LKERERVRLFLHDHFSAKAGGFNLVLGNKKPGAFVPGFITNSRTD
jgi:hypothetical protein